MRTSYYSVTPDHILGAISVSRTMPKNTHYRHYPKLAPGPWFRSANETEYIARYHAEILAPLDPQQVLDELHELANGAVPILLCFESPGQFCHRQLVANWLRENLGVAVEEGRVDKRTGEWVRTTTRVWQLPASDAPDSAITTAVIAPQQLSVTTT